MVKVVLLKEFKNGSASLRVASEKVLLAYFQLRPKLVHEVVKKQLEDPMVRKLLEAVKAQQIVDFELRSNGALL